MFGGLIPDDDRKQQLRTIRTLQAIGAGLIHSLVALSLFFAGGFRLSTTGFSLLLVGFWVGHIAFYLLIRSELNRRFDDPSMTQAQVIWAIFVVLPTLFFMTRFRFLMVPFLPLALIFGAFNMTSRQYITMAVLIVVGYCAVMGLLCIRHPETIRPDEEILGGTVFVPIILAFSLVGNEISRLRQKTLRASDIFARFGGEEFVLLAAGADLYGAAITADRIRNTIRAIDFSDIAPSLTVTLSAGVARYRPKEEIRMIERLPAIIAKQDSAHYEMIWQTATQAQKALLIALSEDPQELVFSKDFQLRYGIGPASSIKASLISLMKKGIVYKTLEGRYRFVDRFMPYWIGGIRK